MSLSLKYLLDQRAQRKDGSYPLKIRINLNRTMAQIPAGYYLMDKDWDAKNQRVKPSCKTIDSVNRFNNSLQSRLAEYYSIANDLDTEGKLDFMKAGTLKQHLTGSAKKSKAKDVFEFIDELMEIKLQAMKRATAKSYLDIKRKLMKFSSSDKLGFTDIDYSFLSKLEAYHLANGAQYASFASYMRALKSIYNQAIKQGVVSERHYPFKDFKLKKTQPSRKALSQEDFLKLKQAKFKAGSALFVAQQYYLASFYLHGMNWKDMSHLRYSNFMNNGQRIRYVRHKTGKPISIGVSEALLQCINHLKSLPYNLKSEDFVFPILNPDVLPDHWDKRLDNRRRKINKTLKDIAQELDIPSFDFYSARHTYATLFMRNSQNIGAVQMSMGHETEAQTREYLTQFGDDLVDQANADFFKEL